DSVTSTSLRMSFGDMTTFSGPIVPGSSGTLPGQISTTAGFSAAASGPITTNHAASETGNGMRFMCCSPFGSSRAVGPRHDPRQVLAQDRRTQIPLDMLHDDFRAACVADVRRLARVVEGVGQVAGQDHILTEFELLADAERAREDAVVGVNAHQHD